MYIRWQWCHERKRKTSRTVWREPVAQRRAILVESVRVDGKPKQRHIAYLGSVSHQIVGDQCRTYPSVYYRAWWWHHVNAKLDRLGNRVPSDDRRRIEAVLAKEVPPVTAEEVTACDLQHQHEWRVEREYGECPGCYLDWPEGQAGVPPRPHFDERERFANVLAAVAGISK